MATLEDILMQKGPDVIVVTPATTVREAVRMMCEANVGSIVVKQDERAEGIFTERDLLRRVVSPGRNPDETPISDVMTSPVETVSLDMDVREASELLNRKRFRHLVIVEQDALVGMISLRDLLRQQLAEDEARLRGE
jgi:CBS domain-containing protein